jgi:DNA-nicking Smr family endonuclease
MPDPDAFEYPIDGVLDLHAFDPRDVRSVVEEYVIAAHARGLREIRVIHGRGKGVQRATVHALLAAHRLVKAFRDAPESHLGATVVQLAAADEA